MKNTDTKKSDYLTTSTLNKKELKHGLCEDYLAFTLILSYFKSKARVHP